MLDFLARLPSTNTRILAGIVLACIVVLGPLAVSVVWPARTPSPDLLVPMYWFVGAMLGLDTAHFLGKRATHRGDSPKPTTNGEGS